MPEAERVFAIYDERKMGTLAWHKAPVAKPMPGQEPSGNDKNTIKCIILPCARAVWNLGCLSFQARAKSSHKL